MRISKKDIIETAKVLTNPIVEVFFDPSAIKGKIRLYKMNNGKVNQVINFNSNRKAWDFLTGELQRETKETINKIDALLDAIKRI